MSNSMSNSKETCLMKMERTSPVPVVLAFLLVGLAVFSIADSGLIGDTGTSIAHFLHHPVVHHIGILALWPFFFVLGAEIKLNDVAAAGRVLIFAILGGMLIPFGLTSALLVGVGGYAMSVALATGAGAMATDVALSIGAIDKFKKSSNNTHWVELSVVALIILAIGDDLGGVIAMTFGFSDSLISKWALLIETVLCIFLWSVGNNAKLKVRIFDDSKKDEEKDFHVITLVESPIFWMVVAVLNTWFLALANIEPILGGCLVMVFAPLTVKHKLEEIMLPWSLRGLVIFGIIAGSINFLNPASWGMVTLLTFAGGFFGKQIGIFFGALIGRKKMPADSTYGKDNFTNKSAYIMALSGAINGTVAIVFVNIAFTTGYISEAVSQQATLGYLLTIPAVYVMAYILAPIMARPDKN